MDIQERERDPGGGAAAAEQGVVGLFEKIRCQPPTGLAWWFWGLLAGCTQN